jgi:uncharacterized protein DUF6532
MQPTTISRHSSSRKAQLRKSSSIIRNSGSRSFVMTPFITKCAITSLLRAILTKFQNREELMGFGKHCVILDILQDALFDDAKSYGIKFSNYFNPISINLLALIFMMVHPLAAATIWSLTGIHSDRLNS